MLGRQWNANEWHSLGILSLKSSFKFQKFKAVAIAIGICCVVGIVPSQESKATEPSAKTNQATIKVELSESNAEVPIQLEFIDVDESTTWKLYASPFIKSIEGAKLLQGTTSITKKSFIWKTANFTESTYYVFVVMERRGNREVFYSEEAIVVDRSKRPGNRSPFVKITRPDNAELILAGEPINFEFESLDTEGDTLTYQLMYKCTGQEDWTIAVNSLIPEQGRNGGFRYEWTPNTDLPESSRCQVRITASDGDKMGFGLTQEAMGMAKTLKDYATIKPILDAHCVSCHSGENPASNFVVTSEDDIPKGNDNRTDGLRRKLNNVVEYINLPVENEKHMPRFSRERDRNPKTPKGYFLKQEEIELLELYRLSIRNSRGND